MSSPSSSYVIDCGSRFTKAGFSGDDSPSLVVPTIIGHPKHPSILPMMMSSSRSYFIGDDAMARRGILRLHYPMEYGKVDSWNDMELFWYHLLWDEMRITDFAGARFFFAESARTTKRERELAAEILFETFNIGEYFTAMAPLLGLYTTGRVSGLAVESGHTATDVVPVFEGVPTRSAMRSTKFGGRDLVELFMRLMMDEGLSFTTASERKIVFHMKETVCYVAENYEEELKKSDDQVKVDYELPDRCEISLKKIRFKCPEAIFKPSMVWYGSTDADPAAIDENDSLTGMITDCIRRVSTDEENKSVLISNITLSGGTTLFKGIEQRLLRDLTPRFAADKKVQIVASPDRKYGAWVGGSILSSLTSMNPLWIKKSEYEEVGSEIVHQRCAAESTSPSSQKMAELIA